PDDELLNKGYEANIDWIIEPTGLKIEDLKKYPGGYSLKNIKMPPYRKYEKEGFPTPSGKMEFTSTILKEFGLEPLPKYKEPELSRQSCPDLAKDFPLILTTGARLPMFIHSRTFRLSWTKGLRPEPMLDINPKDAEVNSLIPPDYRDPISGFPGFKSLICQVQRSAE
ncbi:MAG: hypothetical protein JRJ15_11175, partial [Deltaproteobacteria bacterium]|nr:hypothetical protein [Deltaproteobacteria bacterium]